MDDGQKIKTEEEEEAGRGEMAPITAVDDTPAVRIYNFE